MRTLIKNGLVVTDTEILAADVAVTNEKILNVAENLASDEFDSVVDASGLFVMPGGVDVHVHLDLPMFGTVSSDDHYTGTKAAAFGGTTTVIDFVSQDCDDLEKNVMELRHKADSKVTIDYGLHANITHLTPKVESAIANLPALGVTSIKVFSAYNNRLRLQDDEIFKVLRISKNNGILTMLHAENGDVIDLLVAEAASRGDLTPVWHAKTRPAWGSAEAVARAPLYIVHMNTSGDVDQLQYAQSRGVKVLGETCPQYLFFSEDDLRKSDGAKWICSPPMRSKSDQIRLWQGLEDGTLQTIATDHCPFFFDGTTPISYEGTLIKIPGKELGADDFRKIPNGLPGVGDRLPVMWTKMVGSGSFTPNQFVRLMCTNPAKIFGLYPQKGVIQKGSDADLVLWNPQTNVIYGRSYSQQRTDYNLYEGWNLTGMPEKVFSRGELIVDQGKWLGRAGRGKFIKRQVIEENLLSC